MTQIVKITTKQSLSLYDITIERGSLRSVGEAVRSSCGDKGARAAIISNRKVFDLYGETVAKSLRKAGYRVAVHLIGDGERYKSFKTLQETLRFFGESELTRTDVVVALGGGVVGDLAGFAAAVYLRGVAFVQVPTTLLAMIDSSVGGKTGINTEFGKNLVGAFYQPKSVLIDPDVLNTLPERELTAGFCEAVKQGALAGTSLLNRTSDVLFERQLSDGFEDFLAAQVRFKASIVAGDERESVGKTDAKSRKILNFGHTFGHAIEKLTKYRYFKHGEAVGHGIVFAAELSKKLELLAADEVELLNGVVHRAGKLPPLRGIDPAEVLETFKYDKKNIGDSVQWILLQGIGKPMIVPDRDIPKTAFKEVLRKVIRT